MAKAGRRILTSEDYAALNEDCLLRYREVKETSSDEKTSNVDTNEQQIGICGKAAVVRASRLGILQYAANDSNGIAVIGERSDMTALQQLMECVRMEMDRDASSSESELKAMQNIISAMSHPVEAESEEVTLGERHAQEAEDVDVDAFFEEYPECARSECSSSSENDYFSSDSSYDEDETCNEATAHLRKEKSNDCDSREQPRKNGPPTGKENSAREARQQQEHRKCSLPAGVNPYSSRSNRNATRNTTRAANNNPSSQYCDTDSNKSNLKDAQQHGRPFDPLVHPVDLSREEKEKTRHQFINHQQRQHQQQRPLPHLQQMQPSARHNYSHSQMPSQRPPILPDPSTAPSFSSSSSWEDHRNQNPFQTAREYAQVDTGSGGVNNNDNGQNHHTSSRPPSRGYNPYAKQQQTQSNESPPPPKVAIRDSLKRKFQPPIKRDTLKKNEGQGKERSHTRKGTGLSVSNGYGNAQRPSSKGGSTGGCDDNDEEEDLPEELKRFGKELVEKIESEIMDRGEPITFDDIAGLEDAKQTVQEVVCWPMRRPDIFTGLRRAPNGLLLFGPPGTGKTLIGKAIAHESGATFFSISSSSLTSKWIGEGEKLVRTLFAVAAHREPSVVFIDEIDSLLTQRKSDENEASRRIKTEFLVQLDGTGTSGQGRVLVVGATNRPQELDEAARRRFTKRLYIPLPTENDREILIRVLLGNNNHRLSDGDIKKLAKDTSGFSGADLKSLSTDAAMGPIRQLGARALEVDIKDVPPIGYKHFRQALRGMNPSVASSDLIQYEEWDRIYGNRHAEAEMDDDDDISENDTTH